MLNHTTKKLLAVFMVVVCLAVIFTKCIPEELYLEPPSDTALYTFPDTSSVIIKPKSLCLSRVYLVIIVCSSPLHFAKRMAIRETWGLFSNVPMRVKLYFLLGLTDAQNVQELIFSENEIYDDVIQESFIDTYYNLSIKSLMLLKLFKFECKKKAKFVMKVDDDTFLNVHNLLDFLKTVKKNYTIFGKLMRNCAPFRNSDSKWYVPLNMYHKSVYPNYIAGHAYVMSTESAVRLFNTALTIPIFYIEDIYLTGICAKVADIILEHNCHFYVYEVEFNPRIYRNLISSHYNTPTEMRFLYNSTTKHNYTNAAVKD